MANQRGITLQNAGGQVGKLTKSSIDSITEPGEYRDSELPGFCVRVRLAKKRGTLTKMYVINNRVAGTRESISITIGRHGVISLEQARIEAKKIIALMAQGINPVEKERKIKQEEARERETAQKQEAVKSVTLLDLLNEYVSARTLKAKTEADYYRFLKRCVPDWLGMPFTSITRDMIQKKHLHLSAKSPAQANTTMRILRALFTYAIHVYEDSEGKPLLSLNPVDRLKHARIWNKIPRRQTVIRPHELKAWYEGVCTLRNDTARDVLLLELFTGLRHWEACSLKWSNVDLEDRTILIPDTKNGTDFMLPMSTYLYEMLAQRHERYGHLDYVFPGLKPDSHVTDIRDSVSAVVSASGVKFTEHDLRRTFETTAESLDISYYTLKRLLNHKITYDPTAGYIVSTAERLREAAQRIADCLASSMNISGRIETLQETCLRRIK